ARSPATGDARPGGPAAGRRIEEAVTDYAEPGTAVRRVCRGHAQQRPGDGFGHAAANPKPGEKRGRRSESGAAAGRNPAGRVETAGSGIPVALRQLLRPAEK